MSRTEEKARLKAYQDYCRVADTGCWWHGEDDTNVYITPPTVVPEGWQPD